MKSIIKIIVLLIALNGYAQSTFQECPSFMPEAGEKYLLSAWVKEDHSTSQQSYDNSAIEVVFYNGGLQLDSFTLVPSGPIIEGWQRIIGIFESPNSESSIQIRLKAQNASIDCYFDDVRVFPYNGNMKSFVYDEQTQRLMAELDENNYATYYEYDQEGGLVRVKKETERGVYTIQETRSSTVKQNQ